MSELVDIKKEIQKKQSRLYYITHKKEINQKRKEYKRIPSNNYRDQRINQPKIQKMLYLFKTNKKVNMNELKAFSSINSSKSVTVNISELRRHGHQIKYSKYDGFYYYGGVRTDSDGGLKK